MAGAQILTNQLCDGRERKEEAVYAFDDGVGDTPSDQYYDRHRDHNWTYRSDVLAHHNEMVIE